MVRPNGVQNGLSRHGVGAILDCFVNSRFYPSHWQDEMPFIIPKGKGDPSQVTSWCAIVKKSVCYKLLSYLRTKYVPG